MLREHATLHALDVWRVYAGAFEGEILIRQENAVDGIVQLRRTIRLLEAAGFVLYNAAFEGVLAEGLMACRRYDEADAIRVERPCTLSSFRSGLVRARAHACTRVAPRDA
jgi:hypothetical protein